MTESKPKQKKYYRVKVEGLAPVIINYRVLAGSPEDALEMTEKVDYTKMDGMPKPDLRQLKKKKSVVYLHGTSTILGQKNH